MEHSLRQLCCHAELQIKTVLSVEQSSFSWLRFCFKVKLASILGCQGVKKNNLQLKRGVLSQDVSQTYLAVFCCRWDIQVCDSELPLTMKAWSQVIFTLQFNFTPLGCLRLLRGWNYVSVCWSSAYSDKSFRDSFNSSYFCLLCIWKAWVLESLLQPATLS